MVCTAGHENSKHCLFAAFLVTDARAKRVVSGSEDHSIVIWDLNSKQARLLPPLSALPAQTILQPIAHTNDIILHCSVAHENSCSYRLHGGGDREIDKG